jgi:hypothetical protein
VHWLPRGAAACVVAGLAWATNASAQGTGPPTLGPPKTLDGPSSAIVGLTGMSIARDGTGGIVYLEYVNGAQHVLVSRLVGGVFRAPEQVDSSLGGGSSQPVIAASSGGLLLVAFINSGSLYVARPTASEHWSQPQFIAGGASNPSIQANNFCTAYLAFTVAGGGGSNVRSAYYNNGQWALESASLNAGPGDDAGTGTGRPKVATAGDGIATVVWGEQGHIYTRRVWGTGPSVVDEQADVPSLAGFSEVSAQDPDAAVGGDSSWVGVVFDETLTNGSTQQSRVLYNRLQGSAYNGVIPTDGVTTPGADGAIDPQIAMAEYGNGLATSATQSSDEVFTGVLGMNGSFARTYRVDSLPDASPPHVVPAAVGLNSLVVAWQHDPGILGGADIHARYFTVDNGLGPEQVLSTPSWGPTAAANGIAAGGDQNGDVAVAWVQGDPGSQRIVVGQMYQPPDKPTALSKYARSTHPQLTWQPPVAAWGPMRYTVRVDGVFVGSTTATSITVPARVSKGSHSWSVTAADPAGLQSPASNGKVLIDITPPRLSFTPTTSGRTVTLSLQYSDRSPGVRFSSGIGSVVVKWGDGKSSAVLVGQSRRSHVYARPGRYRVTVIVTDRAMNQTRRVQRVMIA